MWRPRSWEEIKDLIGHAVETASLDFKQELTRNNEELAKDVAAMTLGGGVVLYGIVADEKTGLATEITPVQIGGLEPRVRQVVGSHISPVPDFDTEHFLSPDDASKGVFMVIVPPSALAPHQAGHRYPCRRGTTTGYLEEAEVERLYRQRRESEGEPMTLPALLETQFFPVWSEFSEPGVGQLNLIVRARSGEARHPAGAWQGDHLQAAVRRAIHRQRHRFTNISLVRCFNALFNWEPYGVSAWATGRNAFLGSSRSDCERFGATLGYPARLSFQAQWGLQVVGANDQIMYTSAREIDLARELTAMLAIAGEYFSEVEGGGLIMAALRLDGFDGAISQLGTETRGTINELPRALAGVQTALGAAALELRDTPELPAKRLMENWLPPFYMIEGKKLDRFGEPIELFDLIVSEGVSVVSVEKSG